MSTKRKSDTISRRDAIDALERTKEKNPKGYIARFYNAITDNKITVIEALPSAQPDYDKIIAEIKQCISETREHGKHHAKFVQDNGELYISGLEMALSIIEENR